ncbi:GNAT family N-acetyltransferase [Lysinibacillus sp. LZ02]|uniref:GNAT family N-acetyltransferase n=1 Tax=Lysinibacillus sp. LZ02 TaxID=3420668 RepID=UPI003D364FDD
MTKKMDKKYIPLAEFFQNSTQPEMTLTYEAIENIMGQGLPNAAYLNLSWWKKTKPPLTHYLAWLNAEYNVVDVKLGRSVTFSRLQKNNNGDTGDGTNNQTYIIRTIETDDARAFINLQETIFSECDFEYFNANEQNLTVQKLRKAMMEWRKVKTSTILLCIVNGEFAGYTLINGNISARTKHVASLRIGVAQAFQRTGIGSALLTQAERWAKEHEIQRLEVQILAHNEHARSLFEKHGYVCEGTRKNAFKLQNETFDELYYSKIFMN